MKISRVLAEMYITDLFSLAIALAAEAARRDYASDDDWLYDNFESSYTDTMFELKNRKEGDCHGLRSDAHGAECC